MPRSSAARRPPLRPRRGAEPPAGPRLLHQLGRLHDLAARRCDGSAGGRRRRQQLAMAQRLLDPLPTALLPADGGSVLFWRALRWGGAGLLLARLVGG